MSRRRQILTRWAPPAACVALLGAVLVEGAWLHTPTPETDAYHASVRQAAEALPERIGDWIGRDAEVTRAAQTLLRPNVIISRHYDNFTLGQSADFMIVQCRDATDMVGHYPPVCYPGSGWTLNDSRRVDWQVGALEVPGMEYEFATQTLTRSDNIVVANFMVLPDGTFARNMNGVNAVARNYRKKYYGAAQVLIVFDATVPPAQRREVVAALVAAHASVLDKIRSGVTP